jgi:calcineurin-like phosphoesterase family protein
VCIVIRRLGALLLSWLSACSGKGDPFPSEDPTAWRFAILPDTQIYSRKYPDLFEAQCRWLAENAESQRILFALHEGDIVNDNLPEQWEVAERALRMMDGRLPYVLALGNHDYGPGGSASDRTTLVHNYFTAAELESRPGFGGVFEPGRIDNSFHVFETPTGPWLVLALEFGPRDEVVAWADSVLASHASMPAILVTHAYLYYDDTRYDRPTRPDQMWSPYDYGVSTQPGGVNDGEELYQGLVRRHDSIQLVFNGHVLDDGTARLTSPQDGGSFVHQILANYQNRSRGGDGYLRLVEVDTNLARIRVRTYSPVFDLYRYDDADSFDLPLPELPVGP